MKRNPPTAREDDRLETAQNRMAWAGLHHLVVVRGNRPAGVLSERDLVAHRAADGAWRTAPVRAAMHPCVAFAAPDDPLSAAAGRMAAARVSALPVLEGGAVVGLITAEQVGDEADEAPSAARSVRQVMTTSPITIGVLDPLVDAAARMAQHRIRHLPVLGLAGNLVGILSDRDVRSALGDPSKLDPARADGRAPLLVRDAMSLAPLCALANEPVTSVARLFVDSHLGALPVVDRNDRLIGIISYVDVLRELAG